MKRTAQLGLLPLISAVMPLEAIAFDTVESTLYAMVIKPGSNVVGSRLSLFPPAPEPWLLDISGTFQLKVTHSGLGCSDSPFGPICADEFSTIQLIDPDITIDTGADRAFNFPTYRATFNSPPSFGGDNGPCAIVLPSEHCTGFSNGPLSSMSGSFDGQELALNGHDPAALFGEVTYGYAITASVVPIPGAIYLLGGALVGLFAQRSRH